MRKNKSTSSKITLDILDIAQGSYIADAKTNPQIKALNSELNFVVQTSMDGLPIHYRLPIKLREIDGLSYKEISNITKTTIGTVKSRISRAREIIKKEVDEYNKS